MKIMSVINLLPQGREQVEAFAELLLTELKEGNANPLDVVTARKGIEEVFKLIKGDLDEMAADEAAKYGSQPFDYKGVNITQCAVYTSYDYSGTNDRTLEEIKKSEAEINAAKKEREKMLQNLREPMEVIFDDEIVTVYPPIKLVKQGLKLQLK